MKELLGQSWEAWSGAWVSGLITFLAFLVIGGFGGYYGRKKDNENVNREKDNENVKYYYRLLSTLTGLFAIPVMIGALMELSHIEVAKPVLIIALMSEAGIFGGMGIMFFAYDKVMDDENTGSSNGNVVKIDTISLQKEIDALKEKLEKVNKGMTEGNVQNLGASLSDLNTKVTDAKKALEETFK